MRAVTKIYFDEQAAARYDATSAQMYDPTVLDPAVDFLADLAADGAALEFAIGTGRVALPLSARGVRVSGIDISPWMADQLREKPGADQIEVIVGDYTTTRVHGTFRVVYLVWNSISNVTEQEGQIAAFRNAAEHLEPGGCFVVEVGVPALHLLPPGSTVLPFSVSPDYVGIDEFTDFVGQISYSHHLRIEGDKGFSHSAPYRYVWPSELDLMAQLAGMRRRERFSSWTREPFTGDSTSHVSVWEKAE